MKDDKGASGDGMMVMRLCYHVKLRKNTSLLF